MTADDGQQTGALLGRGSGPETPAAGVRAGPAGNVAAQDYYAIACEVGAAITSSLVLEDVLVTVARRIAEAMGVWECDLYEYYADAETLVASACWAPELSDEDTAWVGTRATLAERPSYVPVLVGRRVTESYVDDDCTDEMDRSLMDAWGELSTLSLPLVFEGDVIGCLTLVEKREVRRFGDDDKQLARLLAVPAAVAVHNARLYRRQEEQNRHLASLLDSSRVLTSTVVLEDALGLVCGQARQALAVDEAVIYEYEPRRDAIVYRAYDGPHDEAPNQDQIGAEYRLDEYPSDRVLLFRGEIVSETVSDRSLPADVRSSMEEWGEKTCLNVPLLSQGEPMGMLVLIETERERRFSAAELELARGLGEQAAVAIRHARLYRRQERQNRRLLALLETSRVLAASLDAGDVLAETRREIAGLFAVPEVAVSLYLRAADGFAPLDVALADEEGDETGEGAAAAPELDDLARRAVEELSPAQAHDAELSRLIVPLVLDGAAEGFVEVRADGGHEFSEDETGLLQVLASQAAAAIVNARLYRAIERQAITDGLTGLYNHRYFYERLGQEVARAQRYGLPLALLMIDIDDFKRFNDRFGHPVGDLVLSEVGRVLNAQLRRNVDFAARYGGEEFAVLLPNTPRDGAEIVGHRLARVLAASARVGTDLPPEHPESARSVGERFRATIAGADLEAPDDGEPVHITVSVGVAAHPGAAGTPDELVRDADKALYLAKRRGKNRVEVFGD